MNFSTRQAAKKLGISHVTLANYVLTGKVTTPQMVSTGSTQTHIWSEEDIEHVRKLLPKIKNGRKTRYRKKHSATGNQQLARLKRRPKKPKAKS